MIVEIRTYQTKPGMRDPFLRLFEEFTIPEHQRLGMPIVGPFLSIEDEDIFCFMRGFSDMTLREELKNQFYEGPLWKEELEKVLMPMLERYDVVVVDDPSGMIISKVVPSSGAEEKTI